MRGRLGDLSNNAEGSTGDLNGAQVAALSSLYCIHGDFCIEAMAVQRLMTGFGVFDRLDLPIVWLCYSVDFGQRLN